ncbi:MAG: phosphopantetheine-binding protein [Myxococcota bacterium]|nr:phosphopantetheine-binding protein [Myxococcota bacterium]
MQRNEIAHIIRELVAEKAEIEPDFDADAQFRKDLGMDSLLALEFITAIEKRLQIRIPEGDYPQMTSLNGTLGVIEQTLAAKA